MNSWNQQVGLPASSRTLDLNMPSSFLKHLSVSKFSKWVFLPSSVFQVLLHSFTQSYLVQEFHVMLPSLSSLRFWCPYPESFSFILYQVFISVSFYLDKSTTINSQPILQQPLSTFCVPGAVPWWLPALFHDYLHLPFDTDWQTIILIIQVQKLGLRIGILRHTVMNS